MSGHWVFTIVNWIPRDCSAMKDFHNFCFSCVSSQQFLVFLIYKLVEINLLFKCNAWGSCSSNPKPLWLWILHVLWLLQHLTLQSWKTFRLLVVAWEAMWFKYCSLYCYFNTFVVVLLFKILQALLSPYCSHSEMSMAVEGNTCMDCLITMSVVGINMLVLLMEPSFLF